MSGLRARLPYLAVAAGIVALDQVTKAIVTRAMEMHESRAVVAGLLDITYVHNRGAAFGFLSDAELPHQAILFVVIGVVALTAIAGYAFRLPAASRLPQTALALVMGGALGNLVDRLRLGHVIDFVDVYWKNHHWPAFNVADSAISVGVALLLLDMLRGSSEEGAGDGARLPAGPTAGGE